jgi:hypothetical protein
MGTDPLELILGAVSGEVCDLWFEGADKVGGGIDDVDTETFDRVGAPVEWFGHTADVRVETNAQGAIAHLPCPLKAGMETVSHWLSPRW